MSKRYANPSAKMSAPIKAYAQSTDKSILHRENLGMTRFCCGELVLRMPAENVDVKRLLSSCRGRAELAKVGSYRMDAFSLGCLDVTPYLYEKLQSIAKERLYLFYCAGNYEPLVLSWDDIQPLVKNQALTEKMAYMRFFWREIFNAPVDGVTRKRHVRVTPHMYHLLQEVTAD